MKVLYHWLTLWDYQEDVAILVTLLYGMKRKDAKKGVASLCIEGGMGIELCVERM